MMQPALFDIVNPEPEPACLHGAPIVGDCPSCDVEAEAMVEQARRQRDFGMKAATATADTRHSSWSDAALAFLRTFAATHSDFAGWQVVAEARALGAVPEASGKAWGGIFTRAAKAGVITRVGYTTDPNRHLNPCPVWRWKGKADS